jgi:hypothetical protein
MHASRRWGEVQLLGLAHSRDGWEVCAEGSHDPLFFEQDVRDANDKAINHLSKEGGGEVLELARDGKVIERTAVPGSLSRADILKTGHAICEAKSIPLVRPETAVEFDVPQEDLEFAVALWHVCLASEDTPWQETNLGVAVQHGPYVLLNRDSGRFTLEQCETTAAAMRRFHEVGCDELASTQSGFLVINEIKVTAEGSSCSTGRFRPARSRREIRPYQSGCGGSGPLLPGATIDVETRLRRRARSLLVLRLADRCGVLRRNDWDKVRSALIHSPTSQYAKASDFRPGHRHRITLAGRPFQ